MLWTIFDILLSIFSIGRFYIFWIIFAILLTICSISEYVQVKYKTNNKIRSTFFIIIFFYHFISVSGHYNFDDTTISYPISYLIGFFFPGFILTIVEIIILIKTLKNKSDEK